MWFASTCILSYVEVPCIQTLCVSNVWGRPGPGLLATSCASTLCLPHKPPCSDRLAAQHAATMTPAETRTLRKPRNSRCESFRKTSGNDSEEHGGAVAEKYDGTSGGCASAQENGPRVGRQEPHLFHHCCRDLQKSAKVIRHGSLWANRPET